MLGERSAEKNLLYKKFVLQHAGRAQRREELARQERNRRRKERNGRRQTNSKNHNAVCFSFSAVCDYHPPPLVRNKALDFEEQIFSARGSFLRNWSFSMLGARNAAKKLVYIRLSFSFSMLGARSAAKTTPYKKFVFRHPGRAQRQFLFAACWARAARRKICPLRNSCVSISDAHNKISFCCMLSARSAEKTFSFLKNCFKKFIA